MLLTGKEDLRVIKTIEGIKSAFEQLICEKEYEKITVKELCDRARINKKTFYNYYPALDDLLAEMQMEISSGYIERIKDYNLPDESEKVNREFFMYSASKGLAYDKITCSSGSYSHIRQKMINRVTEATWEKAPAFKRLNPLVKSIIIEHINSINVNIYRQWVADGKKAPIEDMIALSNVLTCRGLNGVFNK
ncbi:MAG: TetR/AcrR family transcriptional regulator [Clostridia bacterium]|nr:TetR/AcrR family transcriptional regulator [Clostridia bacterium]